MPRPRVHQPEVILDAVEHLIVEHGRSRLTIRALAERAGASNGSIYHTFGSLETVIGAAWLRRAQRFLILQRTAVDEALTAGDARRAVRAAADAPARLAEEDQRAAQFLVTLHRDDVLTGAVAPTVADDLRALDTALAATMRKLAKAMWHQADRAALSVITICVVRLPAALLFREIRDGNVHPHTRAQLAAAVDAVLECGRPPMENQSPGG